MGKQATGAFLAPARAMFGGMRMAQPDNIQMALASDAPP
jgi:hypothetical protein